MLLSMAVALALGQSPPPPATAPCALSPSEAQWLQAALDTWQRTTREILRVGNRPLPWMVVFNRACVWHLAPDPSVAIEAEPVDTALAFDGQRVGVRAARHAGTIHLPSGRDVPAQPTAHASIYGGRRTFFVLALPDVWRANPKAAAEADLDQFFLGVINHELVHTLHLAEVARRVEGLRRRFTLPENLDDDIVETRFRETPGFREAFEAERDLLYRAAEATDAGERQRLAREAVTRIRERRSRHFRGVDAVFTELEDVLLMMEGVAIWAHAQLAAADPRVTFKRSGNTAWVQDEGYALFLLIDRLMPGWQSRVFADPPPSPIGLLEEALAYRFSAVVARRGRRLRTTNEITSMGPFRVVSPHRAPDGRDHVRDAERAREDRAHAVPLQDAAVEALRRRQRNDVVGAERPDQRLDLLRRFRFDHRNLRPGVACQPARRVGKRLVRGDLPALFDELRAQERPLRPAAGNQEDIGRLYERSQRHGSTIARTSSGGTDGPLAEARPSPALQGYLAA